MKNLKYKIAGVFIILIFCLAPLGAIDLNNDTKYINQDNNTDSINQDNETSNIAVEDVESINDTDDDQTEDEVDVVSSENETNLTNATDANLSNYQYDYISVHVDDISVGQNAVVELQTLDFISTGVWVTIDTKREFVWIDHGYGSVEYSGLNVGTHEAKIFCEYTRQTNSTTFKVKPKENPIKDINVKDINASDRVSVDVTVDKGYTGNVGVTLDGVESQFVENENGHVHVDFDRELDPGVHRIAVTTDEDPCFFKSEKTEEFNVNKNLYLDIEVNDTVLGQNPVVKVKTHSKYNGMLVIGSDCGSLELAYAEDGVCYCELDAEDFTEEGTYTVEVLAFSKSPFEQGRDKTTFNIIKA